MIRMKDMGNPFAPAYRATIWVGDDDVPIGGFVDGTRSQVYVPAWGFLEQARAVAVLDAWKRTTGHTVQEWTDPKESWCELCDANAVIRGVDPKFPGATPAAARAVAAAYLIEQDPTLLEGLYP